ncbi:MAG: hypothetical protein WC817_00685 [Patescibacteria group bacterium]|jgi:hypothetical protein
MKKISMLKVLRALLFLLVGFLLSYLFLSISEAKKITSVGWGTLFYANWLYPFYLLLGFLLSATIFRFGRRTYLGVFLGFIVVFLLFTYLTQGQIFHNWRPYGVDAY